MFVPPFSSLFSEFSEEIVSRRNRELHFITPSKAKNPFPWPKKLVYLYNSEAYLFVEELGSFVGVNNI